MAGNLTPAEQAQLRQTIDMFQVIVESQPLDYQSLEILKEAYLKLGMQKEAIDTSKKIAEAYVQLGQLSSAIMEYETILQQFPDDASVKEALEQIESKTTSFQGAAGSGAGAAPGAGAIPGPALESDLDDGKLAMKRIFVDGKLINSDDFNRYWVTPANGIPGQIQEPFLKTLADKGGVSIDESTRLVLAKAKCGFIPIERYDFDMDFIRGFPKELCQKWCILPFDRMSKTVMVATANPFNKQAEKELAPSTPLRILWYYSMPNELMKMIKKVFR